MLRSIVSRYREYQFGRKCARIQLFNNIFFQFLDALCNIQSFDKEFFYNGQETSFINIDS